MLPFLLRAIGTLSAFAFGVYAAFVELKDHQHPKYGLRLKGWLWLGLSLLAVVLGIAADGVQVREDRQDSRARDSIANERHRLDSAFSSTVRADLDSTLERSDTLARRLEGVAFSLGRQGIAQERFAQIIRDARIDALLYIPTDSLGTWQALLPDARGHLPVPTQVTIYLWRPTGFTCGRVPATPPIELIIDHFEDGIVTSGNYPHFIGQAVRYQIENRPLTVRSVAPVTATDLKGLCYTFHYGRLFKPDPTVTSRIALNGTAPDTASLKNAWSSANYEFIARFAIGSNALIVTSDSLVSLQQASVRP